MLFPRTAGRSVRIFPVPPYNSNEPRDSLLRDGAEVVPDSFLYWLMSGCEADVAGLRLIGRFIEILGVSIQPLLNFH